MFCTPLRQSKLGCIPIRMKFQEKEGRAFREVTETAHCVPEVWDKSPSGTEIRQSPR